MSEGAPTQEPEREMASSGCRRAGKRPTSTTGQAERGKNGGRRERGAPAGNQARADMDGRKGDVCGKPQVGFDFRSFGGGLKKYYTQLTTAFPSLRALAYPSLSWLVLAYPSLS